MFARVLGPYLVILAGTGVAHYSQMRTLVSDFGVNSSWPWVTGTFVLLLGLVVIALHPYWRGAAAIMVSVLGWATALKGLFLVTFPQTYMSFAHSAIDTANWGPRAAWIVIALVGLYLAYVGWVPAPSRPTSQSASSSPDLRRAA